MAKKSSEIWSCPHCGAKVDVVSLGLYAEVTCPQCGHTDRVHVQLGGFRLEGILGIGGMSVVYRALDVALQRPLALKVLNDNFRSDPERIERFEKESAMMARVRHENVTSVYSAGRAYDQFYIAMELIDGDNMEHYVTAHGVPEPTEAVRIVREVARGLHAAQMAGLLHRDMKPGNILIDRSGKAKVIDFGLALDAKKGDTEEVIWATPFYVPPETLRREPEDVRTDIYALGMTLAFLLTGVGQFEEPTNSVTTLLECKRNKPAFTEQYPHVPSVLGELVDHMTAFSPAKRPANYDDLEEELADVCNELERLKREATMRAALRRKRMNRSAMAVGVSLLLGGVLAFILSPAKISLFRDPVPVPAEEVDLCNAEMQALQTALNYLDAGETATAEQRLLLLARETKEPTLGAWCARLALFLCTRSDAVSPEAAKEARNLLAQHIQSNEPVLPAGRNVYELLVQEGEKAAQGEPTLQDWFRHKGVWSGLTAENVIDEINHLNTLSCPVPLAFIFRDRVARCALWSLNDRAARQNRELMRRLIPDLQEYAALGKWSDAAEADDNLLHLARLEGIFLLSVAPDRAPDEAALQELRRLEQDEAAPPFLRSLATVKREAATLSLHLCRALQRLKPGKCRAGMSLDALQKALEKDSSGVPASIVQDCRVIFGIATDVYGRQQRILHFLRDEDKLSPELVVILRDWAKRLENTGNVEQAPQHPLVPTNTEEVDKLLQECRDARLVSLLPGSNPISYLDLSSGSGNVGSKFIVRGDIAHFYARFGRVRIEDDELLPVLGLKNETYEKFPLQQGVIQPVTKNLAEHFESTGSGVILHSADDLQPHAAALSDNPRSPILLGTPLLR